MFLEPGSQVAVLKLSFQIVEEIGPSADPRLLCVKVLSCEWGARVYWDSTQNYCWGLRNGDSVSGFCSSRKSFGHPEGCIEWESIGERSVEGS